MEMLAGHAGLAIQQGQARMLVMEDRERIANEIGDVVIQRLFALGTQLHGIAGLIGRDTKPTYWGH